MKLGILLSGNGSNLQAIIDAVSDGRLAADIGIVLSDNPEAYGLVRARNAGLPARHIPPGPGRAVLSRAAEAEYLRALGDAGAELVCLAGFMRIISRNFIRAWPLRVVNIHPSLLPAFPGVNAWEQALDYGVRFTGCTVHFVDEGIDTGPIILQSVVPVEAGDRPETLLERIHRAEHALYPQALELLARGRISVSGRRVLIREKNP